MNNMPRRKLAEIVITYGPGLASNPQVCEGLLRDLVGECRQEIFILVTAVKEQVPADLLTHQSTEPTQLLVARLTKRLIDNCALGEEVARWAVESWAEALGITPLIGTASLAMGTTPTVAPIPIGPGLNRRETIFANSQVLKLIAVVVGAIILLGSWLGLTNLSMGHSANSSTPAKIRGTGLAAVSVLTQLQTARSRGGEPRVGLTTGTEQTEVTLIVFKALVQNARVSGRSVQQTAIVRALAFTQATTEVLASLREIKPAVAQLQRYKEAGK